MGEQAAIWNGNTMGGERPAFTPDGKTDASEYAVLTWRIGYRGPYEGGWLEWK